MDSLIICSNAVLPMIITMLLGYTARSWGMLRETEVTKLNKVAFFFFMPCLLFRNTYQANLSVAVKPGLILYVVLALLALFGAALLYVRRYIREPEQRGVVLIGLFRSNCAIIGLQIAAHLLPDADLSSSAVLLAVVVTVFNALSVIVLSVFNRNSYGPWDALRRIVSNPLLLGSIIGLLFSYFDWKLPIFAERVVSDLAAVASPLAIFLLGAFFRFDSAKKYKRELTLVCMGRLLLIPAVFLGFGLLLGFRGIDFAMLIAIFASSTAINSFTMAQQMGGDAELMGDIVVFTSVLCPFTLFLWCLTASLFGLI